MQHEVKQGECMASIGAAYGYNWKTLWNHPENVTLKSLRQDPNVLFPGDTVFIPDKSLREEVRATDQRHKFVLKGVPETLRIRLLDEFDRPRAGLQYSIQVGSHTHGGQTDANGVLNERIPPGAMNASLFIGKDRGEVKLSVGKLDPLNEVSGAQARLANLGYDTGPVDGVLGPRTQSALREFQEQHNLSPTGELDDLTIAAFKDRHGH